MVQLQKEVLTFAMPWQQTISCIV